MLYSAVCLFTIVCLHPPGLSRRHVSTLFSYGEIRNAAKNCPPLTVARKAGAAAPFLLPNLRPCSRAAQGAPAGEGAAPGARGNPSFQFGGAPPDIPRAPEVPGLPSWRTRQGRARSGQDASPLLSADRAGGRERASEPPTPPRIQELRLPPPQPPSPPTLSSRTWTHLARPSPPSCPWCARRPRRLLLAARLLRGLACLPLSLSLSAAQPVRCSASFSIPPPLAGCIRPLQPLPSQAPTTVV